MKRMYITEKYECENRWELEQIKTLKFAEGYRILESETYEVNGRLFIGFTKK